MNGYTYRTNALPENINRLASTMTAYTPTRTPLELFGLPQKDALVREFEGKPLAALRTPAMIIDRKLFAQNCAKMHQKAESWGAKFRAHLKTHKVKVPCCRVLYMIAHPL